MNEVFLLQYLINKETFAKYGQYVNLDFIKGTSPELTKIYLVLTKLHKEGTALTTVDDLRAHFFNQYPALKRADQEAVNILFDKAKAADLGEQTVETLLESHRMRSAAFRLGEIGYAIAEGHESLETLSKAIDDYKALRPVVEEEIVYVPTDLEALLAQTYSRPGLKWKHKTLRTMMGSLRQGDFGFVFTRPEVGKTTFIADNCSHFAGQVDRPILHFNNEEMGAKVMIRYYQACLGLTTKELFADLKGNQKKFMDLTQGNIKLFDTASLEKNKVEDICAKENPALIVFDSIDKLKGFLDDRDDLVYKQIYQWARELAKVYGPVIGVCHAAVSAENKQYLEMDDVAYAKTAKQGEADWILGIGQVHDQGKEHIRFFHMPKNKLIGDDEMDEQFRHGKLIMRIHPEIGQYSDILFKENQ
jgi:replicative DNA helicase